MDKLVVENRSRIRILARLHRIRRLRLFGSMSRNSATPESDVDLIADLEEDGTLLDLGAFLMDLQDLLGRPVQVVTERSLHPAIRSGALRDAVDL